MYKKFINSTIPHTQYLICCDYDETILSIDSFEFDVEAAQTLPTPTGCVGPGAKHTWEIRKIRRRN
jgi:hypothetical protein